MGGNLETAAVYHFLQVTNSLDSLEVIAGNGYTTSGARTTSQVSVDFLSSLAESYSSIKHLRLVSIRHSNSLSSHLLKFKKLKRLGLHGVFLRTMKREELVASVLRVDVLHLLFYWIDESDPQDKEFAEEIALSTILSRKGLPALKQLMVPSEPIDIAGSETSSPRSL